MCYLISCPSRNPIHGGFLLMCYLISCRSSEPKLKYAKREFMKGSTSGGTTSTPFEEHMLIDENKLDPLSEDSDDSSDDEEDDDSSVSEYWDDIDNDDKELYKVVTEAEISQRVNEDINSTAELLCITTTEAALILLHFNWDIQAVSEKWFDNTEKLRQEVGLIAEKSGAAEETGKQTDMTCGICSKTFAEIEMAAAACGHKFCISCWKDFLDKEIFQDSLIVRCPQPSCMMVLPPDMIAHLSTDEGRSKYSRDLYKSHLNSKNKAKWCPAPDCRNAVLLVTSRSLSKITCSCLHTFCWECTKEAHEPISCRDIHLWEAERDRIKHVRLTQNPIACPKCQLLIAATGCYEHMECKKCGFHFCRDCLSGWMEHGCWEGDRFKHQCYPMTEMVADEQGSVRSKYQQYETHWKAHDSEQQLAYSKIQKLNSGELKMIACRQRVAEEELIFLKNAWLQIAECKRIIKWTFVHDFYRNPSPTDLKLAVDYLFRRSEFAIQQLYQSINDLTMFVHMTGPSPSVFGHFRDNVTTRTSVARIYFENFVWVVQNLLVPCNDTWRMMGTLRTKLQEKLRQSRKVMQPTSGADATPSTLRKCGEGVDCRTCRYCLFENGADSSICLMCYH